jgi:replicative DNA helicase
MIMAGGQDGIEIASQLREGMFCYPRHQRIFKAISYLVEEGMIADSHTVLNRLQETKDIEHVSLKYFFECADPLSFPSLSNANKYIEDLHGFAQRDRLERFAHNLLDDLKKETDTQKLLGEKIEDFLSLGIDHRRMKIEKGEELAMRVLELAEQAHKTGEGVGLPTGFPRLDKLILGLQAGYLILIAARPTCGKTSLATNIMQNISHKHSIPTMFISIEMTAIAIMRRIMASVSDVSSISIRKGDMDDPGWKRLAENTTKMSSKPIYVVDMPRPSIPELMVMGRKGIVQYGIKALFIDYLGLIKTTRSFPTRNEEVTFISQSLKNMARELDIPVVAVSQLSRLGDDREPQLSHLRDSGSLEQDADQVIFIHRWMENQKIRHRLIVAKARNEQVGMFDVLFLPERTQFVEIDNRHGET